MGVVGDVKPNLTQTASFGGRSRIAFLNVPAGLMALSVSIGDTPHMYRHSISCPPRMA